MRPIDDGARCGIVVVARDSGPGIRDVESALRTGFGPRGGPRRGRPDTPASLSRAIRDGKPTFEAAGGPRAYFGYPAKASAEEGQDSIEVLGSILDEAVAARLEGLD